MTTKVNWQRWNDNGTLSAKGKTHQMSDEFGVNKTLCGKSIPSETNIEVEFFDHGHADCKACQKSIK